MNQDQKQKQVNQLNALLNSKDLNARMARKDMMIQIEDSLGNPVGAYTFREGVSAQIMKDLEAGHLDSNHQN